MVEKVVLSSEMVLYWRRIYHIHHVWTVGDSSNEHVRIQAKNIFWSLESSRKQRVASNQGG